MSEWNTDILGYKSKDKGKPPSSGEPIVKPKKDKDKDKDKPPKL